MADSFLDKVSPFLRIGTQAMRAVPALYAAGRTGDPTVASEMLMEQHQMDQRAQAQARQQEMLAQLAEIDPTKPGGLEAAIPILMRHDPNAAFALIGQMTSRAPEPLERVRDAEGRETLVPRSQAAGMVSEPEPRTGLKQVITPQGPIWTPESEAAGQPAPASSGFRITGYDEQGRPLLSLGGQDGPDMAKATQKDVEAGVRGGAKTLANLRRIGERFRPEYQTFPEQFEQKFSAFVERAGVDLDPDDRQELAEYSAFRTEAAQFVNDYIKEITGAQMSENEAARIMKAIPGESDSPTQFQSKLDTVTESIERSMLRDVMIRERGLEHLSPEARATQFPLSLIPDEIRSEGQAIEDQLIEQGMDPEQAKAQAMQHLRQKYGL